MESWDFMRFVYMTEEMLLVGSGPGIPDLPENPYSPEPPEIPTGTQPGGAGNTPGWKPKTPADTCVDAEGRPKPSKECDQATGSGISDPCWILNEYPGVGVYKGDNGVDGIWGTENPLSRGPYKSVVGANGWGAYGAGAWPDSHFASGVWLQYADGQKDCITIGDTGVLCSPPGSMVQAKPCTGTPLPTGSAVNAGPIATMWDRFEACMRTKFPECGTGG